MLLCLGRQAGCGQEALRPTLSCNVSTPIFWEAPTSASCVMAWMGAVCALSDTAGSMHG